jgi:ssDNA-binding replication factor A large subunit
MGGRLERDRGIGHKRGVGMVDGGRVVLDLGGWITTIRVPRVGSRLGSHVSGT